MPFPAATAAFSRDQKSSNSVFGLFTAGTAGFNFGQKMRNGSKIQSLKQLENVETFRVEHRQQHPQQDCRARLTHTHSYLLYVVARFRTSLNKHYIKFFGFPLTLFNRYLPVVNKGVKRCTTKDTIYFIKKTL